MYYIGYKSLFKQNDISFLLLKFHMADQKHHHSN